MKIQQVPVPDGHGKEQLERLSAYLPELCLFQGPWLGGGTVRRMMLGERVDEADLDFFFTDYNQWFEACKRIERVADAMMRTSSAYTYRVPVGDGSQIVQMIKKNMTSNLVDLFKSFDFRVCQFFTDGKTIVYPQAALDDAKTKRLRLAYKGDLHTEGLHARIHKYIKYGFRPDMALMWKVITKVGKASVVDQQEMAEARTYSDSQKLKIERPDPTGLGPNWAQLNPKEKINV